MNSTIAPNFSKRPTPRFRRLCRVLAAIFCIVLVTGASAQAGPVRINQVVQTLSSLQGSTDVHLTLVSQDPATSGGRSSTPQNGPRNDSAPGVGSSDPKLDSLLSGFTVASGNQQIGIADVEEGEVEGTICDCGEILIAGGGFPKWPLLFLTAVPLVFINDCEDCDENENTPTPTPPSTQTSTPTPTPEPASLLLFGTGLVAFGAGLRHRYTKAKLANQKRQTEDDGNV